MTLAVVVDAEISCRVQALVRHSLRQARVACPVCGECCRGRACWCTGRSRGRACALPRGRRGIPRNCCIVQSRNLKPQVSVLLKRTTAAGTAGTLASWRRGRLQRAHHRRGTRRASTTARGAGAAAAGAPASASITASGASARTAGAPASVSITDAGAGARTAGAPAPARYVWSSAPTLFLQEQIKDIIIIQLQDLQVSADEQETYGVPTKG